MEMIRMIVKTTLR